MDRSKGYYRRGRKLMHMAGGVPALALPFAPYWLWLALAAVGLVASYIVKPRHAWWLRVVCKPADRNRQVITGSRIYAWVVVLLLLLWKPLNAIHASGTFLVMFGWMALAFGDGLAGLLGPGPSVGKTVPWNKHKTWWGSFGCLLGCMAAGVLAYAIARPQYAQFASMTVLWLLLLAVSLLTALFESFELKVDDNFLVGMTPPVVSLVLVLLLQSMSGA